MPKVTLDNDTCKMCNLCVEICPMQVFENDGEKVTPTNESNCIGCKACEVQCPVQCIKVE